jgi:hypothetical protein
MASEATSATPDRPASEAEWFKRHRKRVERAWRDREPWDKLYADAYEFAIPYRRPASRRGKGVANVERVFDNTAIVSAFRSAGKLHNDLFPPGQKSFDLVPGPLAKLAIGGDKGEEQQLRREYDRVGTVVSAFMEVPEFDQATTDMCVDLLVGNGALLPIAGDKRRPIRFAALPFDEVAVECDAYGAPVLVSWKTKLTRRQIRGAFPKGDYPSEFVDQEQDHADDEIVIHQDFVDEDPGWKLVVWIERSEEAPIVTETYRTQPVAVPRYYRVPGEAYGRGPVLLALPTVKTLNKAVEIMLKAAAISMLGIWAYRPGGAFNPDTARIAPAQFWPMSSTGGAFGADVARLDTSGRTDVSQLITSDLRQQVQAALHDEPPPPVGATPRSATEIMETIKRTAVNYVGAFGRMVNEIHPVIVRRVIEILHDEKLLDVDLDIDNLLTRVEVRSPIAAALKSQALNVIVEFIELVAAVRGQEAIDLIVRVDDALRHIAAERGVPPEFVTTADEQKELEAKIQRAVAQLASAQAQPQQGTA